jgi:hypothetical protein
MRRICSVVLYVASGVFFYTLSVVAFINEPPAAAKFGIMGVFIVPAIGLLLLGLWALRFISWKRDMGIVMFSASLFTSFLVLSFVCMLVTPEIQQVFPENKLAFFSDYTSGFSCIAFLALCGGFLIWRSRAANFSDKARSA